MHQRNVTQQLQYAFTLFQQGKLKQAEQVGAVVFLTVAQQDLKTHADTEKQLFRRGLEHRDVHAATRQQPGRGQPRRAAPDDEHAPAGGVPPAIEPTESLQRATDGVPCLLVAVPSGAFGGFLRKTSTTVAHLRRQEHRRIKRITGQIGQRLDRPQIVDLRVASEGTTLDNLKPDLEAIVREELAGLPGLTGELLDGRLGLDRWPLRGG